MFDINQTFRCNETTVQIHHCYLQLREAVPGLCSIIDSNNRSHHMKRMACTVKLIKFHRIRSDAAIERMYVVYDSNCNHFSKIKNQNSTHETIHFC